MMRKRRRIQFFGTYTKGFTLLELMVAAAILCFSLTFVLYVLMRSSSLSLHSRDKTIAVTHAKCILEEISDIGTGAIAGVNWLSWLDGLEGVDLLSGEQVIVDVAKAPLEVPVTVSWQEKNRACSITLIGGFLQ